MNVLFIDTETTGMNRVDNDVIQLGGMFVRDGVVLETFDFKCQPVNWKKINPGALKINHISYDDLKKFEKPTITFQRLYELIKTYSDFGNNKLIMAGQNIKNFDWAFIESFWNKNKSPLDKSMDTYLRTDIKYDLMDLTKPLKTLNLVKLENIKLSTIVEAFDIKVTGDLHNALVDIQATHAGFKKALDVWRKSIPTNTQLVGMMSPDIRHLMTELGLL